FLHLGFDQWMGEKYPQIHFERYADDSVPRRQALTSASHAAQKMREGPSKPPYRWRLQTTVSCVG
ncbi:MAG TPA: hypothetical protein VLS45_04450, partial [Methylomicrobium sp.]|nr:hypothetical protein [Methylomicrobium sp.]